jgi:hypothetical protein
MTQAEVDIQIVTRPDQLKRGGGGTVLREFVADLNNVANKQEYNQLRMLLQFTRPEIIEVTPGSTYDQQMIELSIKYSDRDNSGWGKFVDSLTAMGVEDLLDLKGHRLRLKASMEAFGQNQETKEKIEGLVWRLLEIDGAKGGVQAPAAKLSPEEAALQLLTGITSADFAQAALQDPVLRDQSSRIYDQSLLGELVQSGKATLDGDKYTRVEG